jgi:hypothetical protein
MIRVFFLYYIASMLMFATSLVDLTDGSEALLSPLERIGLPINHVVMVFVIAFKFVPIFIAEIERLIKAQTARGVRFDKGNFIKRAMRVGSLLVPLFLSGFRRAEALTIAMEARCYMVNTLLRDSDFMSMSQGLEVRVPLIDHVLASNVLALPGRCKMGSIPKPLLLGALENSLPPEIVNRPKRGFTLPFEHWLRAELRPEIEPMLSPDRIRRGPLGDLLNAPQVQQIWSDFLRGQASWSRPWSLYVLERWCELHSLGT